MTQLSDNPSPELMQRIERSDEYEDIMVRYSEYIDATRDGQHGTTARFWMVYIDLVNLYHRFSRASRTNDLELFIHALGEMCPVFFATSRPNYSRWMVRYQLNLLNVEHTHPGVKGMLEGGAMSIRRTTKDFSRSAVDLTLEQTINADAASRLTGVARFGHSDSARKKWMITRSARSEIVGLLLEKAGLKSKEDVSKELRPHRVQKDNADIKKVTDGIKKTMNPFVTSAEEPDVNLYCLTTGKQTSEGVRDDCWDVFRKEKPGVRSSKMALLKTACDFRSPLVAGR